LLVLIDSNRGGQYPQTSIRLLPSRNPAQAACREVCEPNRRHRVLLVRRRRPRRPRPPQLRPHHEQPAV